MDEEVWVVAEGVAMEDGQEVLFWVAAVLAAVVLVVAVLVAADSEGLEEVVLAVAVRAANGNGLCDNIY